jgi:FAD/FMN-containing dehydrogenase
MSSHDAATGFREGLTRIVRPDQTSDDAATLNEFSRDCSLVSGSRPWLVAYPESKDEVKGIVRLASEFKIPLVPVSSGPPHFHGNTVPTQSGVILDFRKMRRIIKVDTVNRSAMIEPGVTFAELIPEVRKQGVRLNIPLLPRTSKSVLTAYLEREPVLIPKYQYDYIDPMLTLEVIYGTGDELRTGSASGPGDLEHLKSDKVNPWGPGSVDYSRLVSGAQGTMGLVTWATVKTEILPSIQKFYFIHSAGAAELLSLTADLLRKRVLDECLILNNVNLATILADQKQDFKELKENLPPWTLIVCIAGYQRRPEDRVEIQSKQLFNICAENGLQPLADLPGAGGRETVMLELLTDAWAKGPSWKLHFSNACQDIFFLSPLSRVAGYIELMQGLASKHAYARQDTGCYIQPMVQGRGCHCEFNLFYDGSNAAEVARVNSLFKEASQDLINQGAFFSRPYGPWAEMVYRRDAEGAAALKKLKDIFDPHHILNPGKLCF